MPNLRHGIKGGFEPGLSRLRVRLSTTELPRSTILISALGSVSVSIPGGSHTRHDNSGHQPRTLISSDSQIGANM